MRRLELVLGAGHVAHLSGGGLGVETFDIAGDTDLQRAVDMNQGETFTENPPHEVAMVLLRGDEGADDRISLVCEEAGEMCGSPQVFTAIRVAEAEIGAESGT